MTTKPCDQELEGLRCANTKIRNGSVVSIPPSSNWQRDVSILRLGIINSVLEGLAVNVEEITYPNDREFRSAEGSHYLGSQELTRLVESKNIWWVDENELFIRLFNPSRDLLTRVIFQMQHYDSAQVPGERSSRWLSIELGYSPLEPMKYAVYRSFLPFDYAAAFGEEMISGDVMDVYFLPNNLSNNLREKLDDDACL